MFGSNAAPHSVLAAAAVKRRCSGAKQVTNFLLPHACLFQHSFTFFSTRETRSQKHGLADACLLLPRQIPPNLTPERCVSLRVKARVIVAGRR